MRARIEYDCERAFDLNKRQIHRDNDALTRRSVYRTVGIRNEREREREKTEAQCRRSISKSPNEFRANAAETRLARRVNFPGA